MTENIICKASFNELIKSYLLFYIGFFLLISIIGIPLLLVWFLGVGQWWSKHYFEKLSCELTDRSLHFKKGIFVQVEKTIPLENIQDVTFIEGPFLRYYNLCILRIETAGQSAHGSNQMQLIGILDAPAFRTGSQATDSQQILIEIRDSIRQIADFLTKKI